MSASFEVSGQNSLRWKWNQEELQNLRHGITSAATLTKPA